MHKSGGGIGQGALRGEGALQGGVADGLGQHVAKGTVEDVGGFVAGGIGEGEGGGGGVEKGVVEVAVDGCGELTTVGVGGFRDSSMVLLQSYSIIFAFRLWFTCYFSGPSL